MFYTLDKTVFIQIKHHCYCLMDTKFQMCKMKKVLEVKGGDGCTTVWMLLNTIELDTYNE